MNRRDLIQRVVTGGTVLVIMPSVLLSCSKDDGIVPDTLKPTAGSGGGGPITIDLSLAENSVLNNTGGSKVIQNIIVVNTGSDSYVALSSICTHQGTQIGFSSTNNKFICPNHGSEFSTTGSVLLGPATSALKSYSISKTGNLLTITS